MFTVSCGRNRGSNRPKENKIWSDNRQGGGIVNACHRRPVFDFLLKNLSVLSERQREVWLLHEQGLKRKEIAQKLGITYNAVREHIIHAERRFREYERYCLVEERNQQSVFLPLTRGEVKIILAALQLYEKELERGIMYRSGSDWIGRLPFEAKIVADLFDKAQKVIYGKTLTRMPKNWDKDE